MQHDEIVALTNEVFIEEFEQAPEKLRPEANIFTDLGLDSLDTVDLIVALQKKFKVTIRGDERVRDIRTLGDLYGYIAAIKDQQPTA